MGAIPRKISLLAYKFLGEGNEDMLKSLFSRRWILTTLIAIAAMGVLVRLGLWQLDRLEQRRAFNARVLSQTDQPVLDLSGERVPDDITKMEYRQIAVRGRYDHTHEVALRNQVWKDLPGIHLLTPLQIEGSEQFVLVDRGWIPLEDISPEKWGQYQELGVVEVRGVIRASQSSPDFGARVDPTPQPGESLTAWHLADIERIAEQMPYDLLPIYIQQAPGPAWVDLPYRSQPNLVLTEGPHLGYAVQWFTFALILGVGYPFYVRRESES